MNYYKLMLKDGTVQYVKAETIKELIKQYGLATVKHIRTTIIQIDESDFINSQQTI